MLKSVSEKVKNTLRKTFWKMYREPYWKHRLKHLGRNAHIWEGTTIFNPKVVSIGDYSRIDKYVIIEGAEGVDIGRYVHISAFCHLQGGGTLKIGDYAGISSGCKIYSSTNYYTKRMSAALPADHQDIKKVAVIIEKDAFLGLNSVVLPGVKIGEGAFIGANSLVNKNIPPWSIAVGSPAKVIKKRPKHNLPDI